MPIVKITLHWDTGEIKEIGKDDSWVLGATTVNDGVRDVFRSSYGNPIVIAYIMKALEVQFIREFEKNMGESRDTPDRNPPPADPENVEV